jgi:hypothetical protein
VCQTSSSRIIFETLKYPHPWLAEPVIFGDLDIVEPRSNLRFYSLPAAYPIKSPTAHFYLSMDAKVVIQVPDLSLRFT